MTVTLVDSPMTVTILQNNQVTVTEVDQNVSIQQVGVQGPQGEQGASGGSFTHTQNTPASTWTITHSLGYRPAIEVIDSGGSQVEGTYTWSNANTIVAVFSSAFAGFAYLS